MTDTAHPFSWRSIVLPAYLPTLLFSLGEGAMIPVIPVVATERGASLALAGLIAAMLMVGDEFADLPAGWLVARIGERIAMIAAAANGPTAQPARNTPASVDSARARTRAGT